MAADRATKSRAQAGDSGLWPNGIWDYPQKQSGDLVGGAVKSATGGADPVAWWLLSLEVG